MRCLSSFPVAPQDQRYRQLCESWQETWESGSWADNPIFQRYVPLILEDRQQKHRLGEEGLLEALWSELGRDPPFRTKTPESNSGRFMTTVREARVFRETFHLRLFSQLCLCLEMDWLRGSHLGPLLQELERASGQNPEGAADASMATGPKALEAALRRSTANALVASTVWMMDPQSVGKLRVFACVPGPWLEWHQDQNRRLRSAQAGMKWAVEQASGAYMATVAATFALLQDERELLAMGLTISLTDAHRNLDIDGPEVHEENELVSLAASFSIHLCRVRVRWGLGLVRGWPEHTAAFLSPSANVAARRMLLDDFANFQRLGREATSNLAREMVRRSVFHLPAVQQHVRALLEVGSSLSEEYVQWLADDHRRLYGTQVVEDSFNRESKLIRMQMNRRSRTLRQWARLIRSKVLCGVHHFDEHVPAFPAFKGRFLPSEALLPRQCKPSIDMGGLVGVSSSPAWYSPGASTQHIEHCDLEFVRLLFSEGRLADADKAWQNAFLVADNILLRRVSEVAGAAPWLFPTGSCGATASFAWPAQSREAPGGLVCFSPQVQAPEELPWVALLALSEWEAWAFEWKSPLWQSLAWGAHLGAAVAVPIRSPEPLLIVAARNAFWAIPLPVLQQLAVEQGSPVTSGSLFDVLFGLVAYLLGTSEAETLDIVRSRCTPRLSTNAEALLSLDAGLDLFSKADQSDLRKEQDQVRSTVALAKDFEEEYRAKRRTLAPAEPKAKAKSRALRRERRVAWCHPQAPDRIPDGFVEHAEAKKLLPPGGAIWRMLRIGGWQCHQRPHPRVSFTFARWTPRGAMMRCLQHSWRLFLADQGLDESRCPIEGMFDEHFEPLAS